VSAILQRQTFESSRAGEYFDVRLLQAMTGQAVEQFPAVILKELGDNGVDDAEEAGVAPELRVRVLVRGNWLRLVVMDNGRGIKPEVVKGLVNFSTLTSNKAAYRSPTRGLQGNAWKTILGIAHVLGGAAVVIEARGVRHTIRARPDPAGEVMPGYQARDVPARPGTRVAVTLRLDACRHFRPVWWAAAFGLFNPHARVKILKSERPSKHGYAAAPESSETRFFYRPTVPFPGGRWRKYLPTDHTSPHWYDQAALARLVFSHVARARGGGSDMALLDFVRQFRGLTAKAKARAVCAEFPGVRRLGDFEKRRKDVGGLLRAMQQATEPPSAGVLGLVGEAHLHGRLNRWFGVKRHWYKKWQGAVDNVAYAAEVLVAETQQPGKVFYGVNFSPTYEDPLQGTYLSAATVSGQGVGGFLDTSHAHPEWQDDWRGNVAVAFHLTAPGLEFLDKGKTRLRLPAQVTKAVAGVLRLATKTLHRDGERRRKDAARQAKADRERERPRRTDEPSLYPACCRVMQEAVERVSGTGRYRFSSHTLFYTVRRLIQPYTGKELKPKYFEQTLLPQFQREFGALPGLYYEPRGTLYEPHTGVVLPLGTREVEEYRFPCWLYDKILFVEKQGLWPVLQDARLAERYDMAVVAGEGYATEACRVLLREADRERNYQLFVLHDADPWGYNIARTLREATARMPGYKVEVIDLGLRLQEALALDLPEEDFTRKKGLPAGLSFTEKEREYFEGRQIVFGDKPQYACKRVELNAFETVGLVAHTDRTLQENGVRPKVVPDAADLPALGEDVYQEVVRAASTEELTRLVGGNAVAERVAAELRRRVPLSHAREWIDEAIAANPYLSWRAALRQRVREVLQRHGGEMADVVRQAVCAAVGMAQDG
jgi:hypothetical protein